MANDTKEFKQLLGQFIRQLVPVQTEWVICKSVDWDKKTMVATGQKDSLDHEAVLLGKGSVFKRPKPETICLIGVIENRPGMAFLIDAEEVDEYLIEDSTGFKLNLKEGQLTINGDNLGGLVNAIELKTQIDKNTQILQNIQQVFNAWTPTPNDGGAALKSLVSQFTGLPYADLSNIQNEKIKQGNG